MCDGKTNYNGACNINEGYVKYANGHVVQNSGGRCMKPNVCVDCNEGYYSAGAYCRACTKIDNCNVPRCNTAGDTKCTLCEGEYGDGLSGYGRYAYSRFLDDGKTCKRK
ncbi:hypothetical protein CHS0354_024497 [Potamilus streckersoni]|uniref:Uncharacterized protein n=1 Tax=Potamilus streckersoni TaxID=2493646 RepID=A0AAE0WHQ1_9BIVA|nr:hypothetical protein CHS0354_024497 [Potamilus streckersoni]